MLETTFRSIIQFRKHVGSIRGRTHMHGLSCHGVMCAFCMFLSHLVMCWRAWWPKQPAAFPQGWHVHYVLTTGTAGVRGPVQPKTGSDSLSGTCPHAAASPLSPRIISKKIFNIRLNFHGIISIGVLGAMFMKHAEGPGNLQPIGLYFAARCCQA